jgi:hypothetical protein
VRLAVVIGSLTVLVEYIRLLGSPSLFWHVEVLLSSLALAVGIPALWALGFPAIQAAGRVCWFMRSWGAASAGVLGKPVRRLPYGLSLMLRR